MTLTPLETERDVRAFLKTCLAPRGTWPGRTVAQLAKVMPDWVAGPLTRHAPHLAVLRDDIARHEAAAAKARTAYTKALGAWIETEVADTPTPDAPVISTAPSGKCPQNLIGDKAVPGEHHRPDPSGPCTFCQSGRTYVFNARSVNRMWKHAHDGAGRTLCPSGLQATDPMPDDEAARLTLCSGCRAALITPTDSQENPHA
ncbi:hypothetical protein [Streptomyces sp. NPDC007346]|uniref:hypothetical protein n=1 Tax=Streptomyces sp. NPDC007346 TaxID=3154682 RepID=UPI003452B146